MASKPRGGKPHVKSGKTRAGKASAKPKTNKGSRTPKKQPARDRYACRFGAACKRRGKCPFVHDGDDDDTVLAKVEAVRGRKKAKEEADFESAISEARSSCDSSDAGSVEALARGVGFAFTTDEKEVHEYHQCEFNCQPLGQRFDAPHTVLVNALQLANTWNLRWREDPHVLPADRDRPDEREVVSSSEEPDGDVMWALAARLSPDVEPLVGEMAVLFPTVDRALIITKAATLRFGPRITDEWTPVAHSGAVTLYTRHPDVSTDSSVSTVTPARAIQTNNATLTGLNSPQVTSGSTLITYEAAAFYSLGGWNVAVLGTPGAERRVLVPTSWQAKAREHFVYHPERTVANFMAAITTVTTFATRTAASVGPALMTDAVHAAVLAAYQETRPQYSMLLAAARWQDYGFNAMLRGKQPYTIRWWMVTTAALLLLFLAVVAAGLALTPVHHYESCGATPGPTTAPTSSPTAPQVCVPGDVASAREGYLAWLAASVILTAGALAMTPLLAAEAGTAPRARQPRTLPAFLSGHEFLVGDKQWDVATAATEHVTPERPFNAVMSVHPGATEHTMRRATARSERVGAAYPEKNVVFRCDAHGAVAAMTRFAAPTEGATVPTVISEAMQELTQAFQQDITEWPIGSFRPTAAEVDEWFQEYAAAHGQARARVVRRIWDGAPGLVSRDSTPLTGPTVRSNEECASENTFMPKLEFGHKRLRGIEIPHAISVVLMGIMERKLRTRVKAYFNGEQGPGNPILRRWLWAPGKTRSELAALGPAIYETGAVWSSYDFSRWDGSIGPVFLHWLYDLFPTDPELAEYLHHTVKRTITAKLGMFSTAKLRVNGKVTTGSAWTTFGNTLLHIFMVSSAVKECGLEHKFLMGVAGGDDGLNRWAPDTTEAEIESVAKWLLEHYGLKQAPILIGAGEKVDFYSCWWVPTRRASPTAPMGYAFVPKCGRDRIKDGWAIEVLQGTALGRYKAKLMSALAANKGCPFCEPILRYWLAHPALRDVTAIYTRHDVELHKPRADATTASTTEGLVAWTQRYGTSPLLWHTAMLGGPFTNMPSLRTMLLVDYGSEFAPVWNSDAAYIVPTLDDATPPPVPATPPRQPMARLARRLAAACARPVRALRRKVTTWRHGRRPSPPPSPPTEPDDDVPNMELKYHPASPPPTPHSGARTHRPSPLRRLASERARECEGPILEEVVVQGGAATATTRPDPGAANVVEEDQKETPSNQPSTAANATAEAAHVPPRDTALAPPPAGGGAPAVPLRGRGALLPVRAVTLALLLVVAHGAHSWIGPQALEVATLGIRGGCTQVGPWEHTGVSGTAPGPTNLLQHHSWTPPWNQHHAPKMPATKKQTKNTKHTKKTAPARTRRKAIPRHIEKGNRTKGKRIPVHNERDYLQGVVDSQKNATVWAKGLFDPFGAGLAQRLPDSGSMIPTYAFPMYLRGSLPAVVPSGAPTVAESAIIVCPDPFLGASVLTAEVGSGTWNTWSAQGDLSLCPQNLSVLTTTAALYRVTSVGLRVYNTAPLQDRGGSWQTASFYDVCQYGSTAPIPAYITSSALNSMQQMVSGDAAGLGGDGVRLAWVPATDRNDQVPYAYNNVLAVTALGWKGPGYMNGGSLSRVADAALIFRSLITNNASTSALLNYEVVWNVEMIPFASTEMTYPGALVPGSPSAITNEVNKMEADGPKTFGNQVRLASAAGAGLGPMGAPPETTSPQAVVTGEGKVGHPPPSSTGGLNGMVGELTKGAVDLISGLELEAHRAATAMGFPRLSPLWPHRHRIHASVKGGVAARSWDLREHGIRSPKALAVWKSWALYEMQRGRGMRGPDGVGEPRFGVLAAALRELDPEDERTDDSKEAAIAYANRCREEQQRFHVIGRWDTLNPPEVDHADGTTADDGEDANPYEDGDGDPILVSEQSDHEAPDHRAPAVGRPGAPAPLSASGGQRLSTRGPSRPT